jgi:hypothetical protein
MSVPSSVPFEVVQQLEREQIQERRLNAGFDEQPLAPPPGPVGLALSGGGIRSAAFNLGLLQAFYQHGLLRYVDYLSTVSGGSYIGGWFSNEICRLSPEARPFAPRNAPSPSPVDPKHVLPLAPDAQGGHSPAVQRLLQVGDYLSHPLAFMNRYAVSLLLINLVLLSLLLTICSGLALLWRLLDWPVVSEVIILLSGRVMYEVVRPFFFTMILVGVWLLSWVLAYWRSRVRQQVRLGWVFWSVWLAAIGLTAGLRLLDMQDFEWWPLGFLLWAILRPLPFLLCICWPLAWRLTMSPAATAAEGWENIKIRQRVVLLAAGVSFLIGWAVWLANPSVYYVTNVSLPEAGNHDQIEGHANWLLPLLGFMLAPLLALFQPQRLLQSGLNPKRFWEPWVFRATCSAIVLGIPLIGTYWFARHDFSGCNAALRDNEKLLHHDIRWKPFWKRIKQEMGHDCCGLSAFLWQQVTEDEHTKNIFNNAWSQRIFNEQSMPYWPPHLADRNHVADRLTAVIADPAFRKQPQVAEILDYLASPKPEKETPAIKRAKKYKYWDELERSWVADRNGNKEGGGKHLNRLLLEAIFQDELLPKPFVHRFRVIYADEWWRLACFAAALVALFFSAWLVNLNKTSLHQFYRERLADAYLRTDVKQGRQLDACLSRLNTVSRGGPYHLISATVSLTGLWDMVTRTMGLALSHEKSGQELTAGFLFSRLFCGTEQTQYRSTGDYERGAGGKTGGSSPFGSCLCEQTDPKGHEPGWPQLGDAIALSGAALTPTRIENPLALLLMTSWNLRLGQWLPSPGTDPAAWPPTPGNLLWERCHQRSPQPPSYVFVSDGGHYENLGLEVLLQRRCRLIVVSDATCDPTYQFADFERLCRRVRLRCGTTFVDATAQAAPGPIPLNAVRPLQRRDDYHGNQAERKTVDWLGEHEQKTVDALSKKHFVLARIQYTNLCVDEKKEQVDHAYLVYVKPSLTGDEDVDLRAYWAAQREFPHDTTSNQFYDLDKAESYRQLGYHIGEELCRDLLAANPQVDMWQDRKFGLHEWIEPLIRAEGTAGPQPPSPPPGAPPGEPPTASPPEPAPRKPIPVPTVQAKNLGPPSPKENRKKRKRWHGPKKPR